MIPHDRLLLLDTNILVHLIRGTELGRRIEERFDLRHRPERPLVSAVTLGEMLALARKWGWGSEKRRLLQDLAAELIVVDLRSTDVLTSYAEADFLARSQGQPMGQNDLWIAATAHATGAHLLTTDKDFDPLAPDFLIRTWIDPRQAHS